MAVSASHSSHDACGLTCPDRNYATLKAINVVAGISTLWAIGLTQYTLIKLEVVEGQVTTNSVGPHDVAYALFFIATLIYVTWRHAVAYRAMPKATRQHPLTREDLRLTAFLLYAALALVSTSVFARDVRAVAYVLLAGVASIPIRLMVYCWRRFADAPYSLDRLISAIPASRRTGGYDVAHRLPSVLRAEEHKWLGRFLLLLSFTAGATLNSAWIGALADFSPSLRGLYEGSGYWFAGLTLALLAIESTIGYTLASMVGAPTSRHGSDAQRRVLLPPYEKYLVPHWTHLDEEEWERAYDPPATVSRGVPHS